MSRPLYTCNTGIRSSSGWVCLAPAAISEFRHNKRRDSTQHNDDHFEGILGVLDLSLPVGGVLGLAGPRLDRPISEGS